MVKADSNRVLEVKGICKRYASVEAVKELSFSLDDGGILALLGPNGAGKTTALRMLLDIIPPDSGSISWDLKGFRGGTPDPKQIGYLPEERGLYPDVPVLNTLVYLASIRGMDAGAARTAAMNWLERMGLADRAAEKLNNLSKGNQQKIQFVASILHKPSFVILDEPFSGLDPVNQDLFIDYIRELTEQGVSVIVSAHQMQLVEKIAREVLILSRGQAIYQGTIASLRGRHSRQQKVMDVAFSRPDLAAGLRELPDFEAVLADGDRQRKLILKPEADMNRVLSMLAGLEGIVGVSGHKEELHDIFVKLVGEHDEVS